ncbi:MAG: pyridoxal-dependent decarboxylase, partial [Gemmatimonadales bacterium]
VSQREGLWLHVDGAFGALAALSPTLKKLTSGMERADSLAFDLHKWMYLPYEVGGVLVRDSEAHRNTFAVSADYLSLTEGGIAGDRSWFSEYGLQLSRGFRALKVWMALKEHGVEKFGRVIEQNVDQARYLARLVEESPDLELLAPVTLNVVCFRFKGPTYCRDDELNELNSDLLIKLQESGVAAPSHTVIGGKFALRVANTNHRTRKDDFFVMVREVERLGRELVNTHPTVFCATEKTASSWDNWKPPGRGAVGVKGLR